MPELRPAESDAKGRFRRTVFVASALFLFACALRFFRLGAWSFWSDEIATLRDAQDLRGVIGYPVGYALIGWVVSLGGASELVARIVPAVAGAATVPVLYLIGRRIFSNRAGWLAAIFLALSTYHLFFSQFARYYTLLVLIGLLAMWALYCGIERNRKRWLLAGLFLLGIAFWTHWSAGLLVPAVVVYLIWSAAGADRPKGLVRANVALLLAPVVIGGIILAPATLRFLAGWTGTAGFSVRRAGWTVAKLLYRMEIAAILCAGAGAWMMLRRRDRRVKWLLAFGVVPPMLAVLFVGFSKGGSRFGIVSLPAVMLLAGAALDLMLKGLPDKRRKLVYVVAGLVVFSMGMKDIAYFTTEKGQRPRWREAAGYTAELIRARGERYLVYAPSPHVVRHYTINHSQPPLEVRKGSLGSLLLTGPPLPPRRIYWLVEHVANVAPPASLIAEAEKVAKLERRWPLRVGPFKALDYSISLYSRYEPPISTLPD